MARPADGAAAQILMNHEVTQAYGKSVLAEILSVGIAADMPDRLERSAVNALNAALLKAGAELGQLDRIEFLESSAELVLSVINTFPPHIEDQLRKIVNPSGGALLFGSPWGASGSIMLDRLIRGLLQKGGGFGAVVVTAEGGQAAAMLLHVS